MRGFEDRLRRHRPADPVVEVADTADAVRRAAVAALLRERDGRLETLLMKRTERDGDHWSGQICLPGGGEEDHDDDLRATAVRETWEELGFDLLACAEPLGRLERIQARHRGGLVPLVITPYTFVRTASFEIELGDEAEDAFWFPLDRAAAGELDAEFRYEALDGEIRHLPCWVHEGRTVWGLTFHMLGRLIRALEG